MAEGHVCVAIVEKQRVLFTTGCANTEARQGRSGTLHGYFNCKENSSSIALSGYWRKCKEVRAEEAICQVDQVSIKRAGDKNTYSSWSSLAIPYFAEGGSLGVPAVKYCCCAALLQLAVSVPAL
jgi:hypothetical protein